VRIEHGSIAERGEMRDANKTLNDDRVRLMFRAVTRLAFSLLGALIQIADFELFQRLCDDDNEVTTKII
jgi:hypothetical protein